MNLSQIKATRARYNSTKMAIFSSLSSWFRRNRRKLLITSSVSFALYLLFNHFVIKRFQNFQNTLKQEAFVREQIKRRFAQTQKDCYLTILALLPVLTQPVIDHLPVELITQALKNKKGTPQAKNGAKLVPAPLTDSMLTTDNLENLERASNFGDDLSFYGNQLKTELWKMLKIKTITRFLTLTYTLSGLLIITRLSMNILARRSYLETAIQMAGTAKLASNNASASASASAESQDYFAEQSFLSLSWWLLNKGWIQLADSIELLVIKHFDSVNARTELSIQEFTDLVSLIVGELNSPAYKKLIVSSVFPPNNQEAVLETLSNTTPEIIPDLYEQDSTLVKLIDETYFFINEDPLFLNTFYNMVENSNLITLSNSLTISLEPEILMQQPDSHISVVSDKKFKLASLLAQISIQSGVLCDTNNSPYNEEFENDLELSGNVYINNLDHLDILDELSASIYSNFQ